jgi:hypothetical protein
MILQKDSTTMIGTLRKDKLVNNFHPMKITLTIWKVSFGLCNLLILWHYATSTNMVFFNTMRNQNIQMKKCSDVLCIWERFINQTFGIWFPLEANRLKGGRKSRWVNDRLFSYIKHCCDSDTTREQRYNDRDNEERQTSR